MAQARPGCSESPNDLVGDRGTKKKKRMGPPVGNSSYDSSIESVVDSKGFRVLFIYYI